MGTLGNSLNRCILILLGCLSLSLGFQNCGGDFQKKEEVVIENTYVAEPQGLNNSPFIRDLSVVAQSSVATVNRDLNRASNYVLPAMDDTNISLTLIVDPKDQDDYHLRLQHGDEDRNLSFEISLNEMRDILYRTPRVFSMAPNEYLVFFVNNDIDTLYGAYTQGTTLVFLWEENLPAATTYRDFYDAPLFNFAEGGGWAWTININNTIYDNMETNLPTVTICSSSEVAIGRECAPLQIQCTLDNGQGLRDLIQFDGQRLASYADACLFPTCDIGFELIQNQCSIICTDNSTTRIGLGANSVCMANERTCQVGQGSGIELLLNDGSYGDCTIDTCPVGFVVEDNACSSICAENEVYDPDTAICYPATRDCDIANGQGQQEFSNGEYGACVAVSCDTGYVVRNQSCRLTTDGSLTKYVNVAHNQNMDLNTICGAGFKPIGCLSGERRETPVNHGVNVGRYRTWGGGSGLGTFIEYWDNSRRYCYSSGQTRDSDSSDLLVGFKCSNVANNQVSVQNRTTPNIGGDRGRDGGGF